MALYTRPEPTRPRSADQPDERRCTRTARGSTSHWPTPQGPPPYLRGNAMKSKGIFKKKSFSCNFLLILADTPHSLIPSVLGQSGLDR